METSVLPARPHGPIYAPDPAVTASVYGSGILDGVLRDGFAPLFHVVDAGLSPEWEGWVIRYARRGEHLKLRLHGPPAEAGAMRELVSETIGAALVDLHPSHAPPLRLGRPKAPPIDEHDEPEDDHPDYTLAWTAYRRSAVSLGPDPWLRDDGLVGRLTGCLAAGARLALEVLEEAGPVGPTPAERQRVLVRAVVEGLAGLPVDRAGYLAYHRDWLLRFVAGDAAREAAARAGFDAQAARAAGTVARLSEALEDGWRAPPAGPSGPFAARLAELHRYAAGFQGDAAYATDPFAPGVAHPPLFKALHGLANQLGVAPAAEAFVHHLLLRAAAARGEARAA